MRQYNTQPKFLIDIVKKTIDLKAFVERESGVTLSIESHNHWKGLCPLHRDGEPSFMVSKESDGIWIYHCFGCQSGGTIIDFCMERFGIMNAYSAAVFAAEKEGIKCDSSLIIKAAREAQIKTDVQNNINLSHFIACESCRKLLRISNGDKDTIMWVTQTFNEMNHLLECQLTKIDAFDKFMEEACDRMSKFY